jgi:hypothetical protein
MPTVNGKRLLKYILNEEHAGFNWANSKQGKTMQSYDCCNKSCGSILGEGLAELLAFQEGSCYIAPVTIMYHNLVESYPSTTTFTLLAIKYFSCETYTCSCVTFPLDSSTLHTPTLSSTARRMYVCMYVVSCFFCLSQPEDGLYFLPSSNEKIIENETAKPKLHIPNIIHVYKLM